MEHEHQRFPFEDAIPDLTLGLIGIPVAMSLQEIVQAIVKSPNDTLRQIEGIAYFFFVMLMYGMLSIGLLILFESDRESDRVEVWQKQLVKKFIVLFIPLFCVTGLLMVLGATYAEKSIKVEMWGEEVALQPLLVISTVFLSGAVPYWVWRSPPARARFEPSLPYYYYGYWSLILLAIGWLISLDHLHH